MSETPPCGLQWTISSFGRLLTLTLALASLFVSAYVGYRYVGLVDCLRERDTADQRRTSAIAAATDLERRADLDLIRLPATPDLRAAAVTAREHTDAVRAAYPAPEVRPCS